MTSIKYKVARGCGNPEHNIFTALQQTNAKKKSLIDQNLV